MLGEEEKSYKRIINADELIKQAAHLLGMYGDDEDKVLEHFKDNMGIEIKPLIFERIITAARKHNDRVAARSLKDWYRNRIAFYNAIMNTDHVKIREKLHASKQLEELLGLRSSAGGEKDPMELAEEIRTALSEMDKQFESDAA